MFPNSLTKSFVFDDDGGAGSGGSTNSGGSLPPSIVSLPDEVQQGFKNLLSRQGSFDTMAALLYQENHGYRDRIRQLENDLKAAKKLAPPENAVILKDDELEQWKAYQALGKPEEVKELQGKLEQSLEQLGALQKRETLRNVAEVAKYKPSVLERLAVDLDFEIKEVEQDGAKIKVAYVKQDQGDGKVTETALADYAKTAWADFLPALTSEQQPAQPAGTRFPQQQPGGGKPPQTDILSDFIATSQKVRDEKPNPLKR